MDSSELKSLLKKVKGAQIDLDTAFHELKKLPFEDIGYAKVDTHKIAVKGSNEGLAPHSQESKQKLKLAKGF